VFRIYALPLRMVNAANWCIAVDIGGKKDFIKSRATRELPTPSAVFRHDASHRNPLRNPSRSLNVKLLRTQSLGKSVIESGGRLGDPNIHWWQVSDAGVENAPFIYFSICILTGSHNGRRTEPHFTSLVTRRTSLDMGARTARCRSRLRQTNRRPPSG